MAKNGYPVRYYKIAGAASNFYDPSAGNGFTKDGGLKVVNNFIVPYKGMISKRMKIALQNGHIQEATKEEFEDFVSDQTTETIRVWNLGMKDIDRNTPEPAPAASVDVEEEADDEVDFSSMTKKQLVKYYEDEYQDVSEDDIEEFTSKTKAEMIEYLTSEE